MFDLRNFQIFSLKRGFLTFGRHVLRRSISTWAMWRSTTDPSKTALSSDLASEIQFVQHLETFRFGWIGLFNTQVSLVSSCFLPERFLFHFQCPRLFDIYAHFQPKFSKCCGPRKSSSPSVKIISVDLCCKPVWSKMFPEVKLVAKLHIRR